VTAPDPMPMFPLGSVLLPSMLLPLHVFEERYRRMLDVVLSSEPPEFGVVLIARGSEVGGGDQRVDVGCAATVLEARQAPDGRWALVCVGTRRVRVAEWLPDDPFPVARVEDWPDRAEDGADLDGALAEVEARVRRVAAIASELGNPGLPEPLELSDDPVQRSYQLGVLSPLGALDRQVVLEADGPAERLTLLGRLLEDQEQVLRARLALGD
jgi:Lon protease-like protein